MLDSVTTRRSTAPGRGLQVSNDPPDSTPKPASLDPAPSGQGMDARGLLCGFYEWLLQQRPETLGDLEFWTGPRLVDQYLQELSHGC